jgi:hypothetical protein
VKGDKGCTTGVVSATYSDSWGTITADSDVLNGPTFDATGLFSVYDGFFMGGKVRTNTNLAPVKAGGEKEESGFEVKDYAVAAGYRAPAYSFGIEL